jgi:hypothetical protein
MDGWLVFHVAMPQIHVTYELRLRYASEHDWDCLVFTGGQLQSSFSGDQMTSANDLWSQVFTAIGAPGAVASGD